LHQWLKLFDPDGFYERYVPAAKRFLFVNETPNNMYALVNKACNFESVEVSRISNGKTICNIMHDWPIWKSLHDGDNRVLTHKQLLTCPVPKAGEILYVPDYSDLSMY
tara:strand:+ start:3681 stop:4004 length:324 start_codon:yes stop_codon:yes gene_type:complete